MRNDEFVYGCDREVHDWMAKIVGTEWYGYVTLGMKRDGELIAACLFDRFGPRECSIHIASKPGVHWATREARHRLFQYAFVQLDRKRLTGETPVWNLAAQKFNEHIGFVREGIKRGAADDGSDAILYGMLKSECRWL